MNSVNIIKNALVYVFLYMPPLIIYWKIWLIKDRKKYIMSVITVIYLSLSIFTQNLLPFILVLFIFSFTKKYNPLEYEKYNLNLKSVKITTVLKLFLLCYGFCIGISAVETYLINIFRVSLREQDVVDWMVKLPFNKFIIMIPVTVIFAPVVEEFIFRVLLYDKVLFKRIGKIGGAMISSLIFAAVHYNLKAFPILVWIGIFNCYLLNKKGYWYSVLNHSMFNSITTIVILLSKINIIK